MEKSTRKNIISAIITIFILLIGVFAFQKMSSMKTSTVSDQAVKKERRQVQFEQYEASSAKNEIELDGRLKAHEQVNITSKVQGLLLDGSPTVREGMYFKKGQLMFSIDKKEADYTLKAQKSALMTSITAMMPDLKFDYPKAFDKWNQYLNDFDVEKDLIALPEPSSQQEKYFVAGKNIYNQFYSAKSQETRLKEYNIYAPFSGVVTAINVYGGALINPNQVLATMINTSRYEIVATVPLDNSKYIHTGQKVTLVSEELDQKWNGTVSRIGTQIDANTQNLPIYIAVSGKGLKDGMYLKGVLTGNTLEDVIKLPKDIFLSPNSVFVIEDSTLVSRQIVSVKRGQDSVLVRGIAPSDKVVVGSLAGLFEGQKVNY